MAASWVCHYCGYRAGLNSYYWRCPRCGKPLDLDYTLAWSPRGRGLARYSTMLPLEPLVSLGEGSTPLITARLDGFNILFKLEYLNPTGSFKDRGTALAISLARRLGYHTVVEDTSGNTGIAVAAYASTAGLRARIYLPRDAPRYKKLLVKLLGAEVVETATRGEAAEKVLEYVEHNETAFYVAHTWSPLYIEGAKTIAFEVFEEKHVPDAIIVPVGSAGLLLGVYRGFRQLQQLGLTNTIPRLIAVQGVEVHPLYKKLYGHKPGTKGTSRLADGLRVPNPPRLEEAAKAIKETRGCVILVNDHEIAHGLRQLLSMGLIVEPTSATIAPAIRKAAEQQCIDRGETILAILTGSGLKTAEEAFSHVGPQPH